MSKVKAHWDAARGRWRIRAVRGGKWFRERGKRGVSFLPHLFTLLNLTCGIYSIILTAQQEFALAALLIGGALVADGLDGRIARLVRVDGEFGKELDSLADVVAFGAAPAILAYETALHHLGPIGLALTALFPVCGALRLARFNIIKTSGFFRGLPITVAGTLVAAMVFYYQDTRFIGTLLLPAAMLILAFLMVSTIPYPDFKKVRGRLSPTRFIVPMVVAVAALVRQPASVLVVPLITYALLGPYLYMIEKAVRKVAESRAADGGS